MQMPQDPSMMGMGDPSMMGGMPQDPSMMGMGDPSMMGGDPSAMGGMPQDPSMMGQGQGSPFDTGFDAGVAADEDEDPKKYIQQLTGKLSQELNKYNNEMGQPDEELDKYVGKMISKAAAKFLDEKGRKDLIKSINTCEEPDDEEGAEQDGSNGSEQPEMPQMDGGQEQMPMNEFWFSKKDLLESLDMYNTDDDDRPNKKKKSSKKYSIFQNPFQSPFK